jgi:hypothetical protein
MLVNTFLIGIVETRGHERHGRSGRIFAQRRKERIIKKELGLVFFAIFAALRETNFAFA